VIRGLYWTVKEALALKAFPKELVTVTEKAAPLSVNTVGERV